MSIVRKQLKKKKWKNSTADTVREQTTEGKLKQVREVKKKIEKKDKWKVGSGKMEVAK